MGSLDRLTEALAGGGQVLWDPPTHPRLLLPRGVKARLAPDQAVIREVLRRAALFRAQALTPGPWPYLVLPDTARARGCLSCSARIDPGRLRCDLCAVAVALAVQASQTRPEGC